MCVPLVRVKVHVGRKGAQVNERGARATAGVPSLVFRACILLGMNRLESFDASACTGRYQGIRTFARWKSYEILKALFCMCIH